ncbi:MAG: glycoside hydrolase family 16 protein [Bacteroidota bacterium]
MKIRKITECLVFLWLLVIVSCNSDETQTVANFDVLVFEDNFDVDGAPDPTKWTFDIGTGEDQNLVRWGNDELQYYTNRTENVKVENGFLLITAIEENFQGSTYTSARLKTQGLFQQKYGRFEARMRLPFGQGMWPAFWMLGDDSDGEEWPQIGEIDIMENTGDNPIEIFGSIHGPEFSGGESISKKIELQNSRVDNEFHVYGIEWGEDYINFYVDDELYNQLTPDDVIDETDGLGEWVFNDRDFYMLINLAVGGNLPGPPDANTVFPQTMLVDYVRVYQ